MYVNNLKEILNLTFFVVLLQNLVLYLLKSSLLKYNFVENSQGLSTKIGKTKVDLYMNLIIT